MSAAQSVGAKTRWELCAKLADKLATDKHHVHNKLYSRLQAEGLTDAVLADDPAALDAVMGWPEYADRQSSGWTPRLSTGEDRSKGYAAVDRMKLTFWFVEKMGGFDKARKVLDLAERMAQELDD